MAFVEEYIFRFADISFSLGWPYLYLVCCILSWIAYLVYREDHDIKIPFISFIFQLIPLVFTIIYFFNKSAQIESNTIQVISQMILMIPVYFLDLLFFFSVEDEPAI